ncbi:MAG: imidazolonepropionase-like amidohydrolase/Tol biopolymer transport system component [Phenylobacterium sp.]|jgi:imidazolonepropionase-like amidohydrolase/Tol biopolymer transport system component
MSALTTYKEKKENRFMRSRLTPYLHGALLLCSMVVYAADDKPAKWDVTQPQGEFVTATIDTDESTWSSVDISADGETIVFDMLGDIYTMPASGGEAKAISQGIGWDMQPVFSPDGQKIAFVSDRDGGDNIWVMNADGSGAKAITTEKSNLAHDPDWSPDGQYIVARKGFTSGRSKAAGEVWVFHRSGGEGLQLIKRPHGKKDQKDRGEATYSADGRYVYFSEDATPGRVWQYNKNPTDEVFVIKRLDRDNGEVETIVDGPGGAVRPAVSHDGKLLAFVKRVDTTSVLFLKDLTSGKQWPIYQKMERDLQETSGNHGMYPKFNWTADDKSLVFWAGGKIRKVDVDSKVAQVIPFKVKTELKIQKALRFKVDVAPDTLDIKMPRWAQVSPQGDKLVFQALGHLYVQDYPSGKPKRLTKQNNHFEFYPSFSRDGKKIVYVSWDDDKLGHIRQISTRGRKAKLITEQPGHYISPKFSPDGKQVVYRKVSGGYLTSPEWSMTTGIFLTSVKKGQPIQLSKSGSNPHYGSSAERIFFSDRNDTGGLTFKSVDSHGHQERSHLNGAKVTEFALSPDGRWVGFTQQFNAWITPFHLTGQTVDISTKSEALPLVQVAKASGEFMHWSGDSDELFWSLGTQVFGRKLKEAFAFIAGAPEKLPAPVSQGMQIKMQRKADKPQGLVAFKGAQIITMRGDEVIKHGVVVVENNRIIAVGDANTKIPAKAKVVDVTGKTMIPGLVDVHAHGGQASYEIVPQQNWSHYSSIAFGVTTIHDPSNDTSEIFAAAEMIRSGQIVGPRIFSTGTILYGAKGPGYTATINNLEDARFHVKRLKDVGAISVKSYNQPRRDQRQQVIQAGREMGMMVVPEGGAKVQHNMNMIVDGHTGVEHALPVTHFYQDLKQLWSQSETGYTPTLGVAYGGISGENYWYDRTEVWKNERLLRYTPANEVVPVSIRRRTAPDSHYNHFQVAKMAKEMMDLGVSVQLGAHGQREGLAAHWELWMFEQGGMTPLQAIRAGTIAGAKYLGMDSDIGSIEAGKLADLVIIDGDVLRDLKRSEYVQYTMINGRLYEAATMNEVVTGDRKRKPFYFE